MAAGVKSVSVGTKACPLCSTKIAPEKAKCPSCGHWMFNAGGQADAGQYDKNDGSLLLEDVNDQEIERIDANVLNHCLDGGLVRSDVILIGGGPGAGKSTAMLQVAESLTETGLVMYVSAEEDIRKIKMRADRLEIKARRRIRLLPALSGVANVGAMLWAHRPSAIIIDSIDALSGHNDGEEMIILSVLKKFCVELNAPAIVINQVTKDGDYSGLKAKQHLVDVLLTFDSDESINVGIDFIRYMKTIKNRSGRAGLEAWFEMTELGLVSTLGPDAEPDSDSEPESVPE